jgi:hypothetical protein
MPKNKVSDPITDQESAFARQVLSGGMTDRQAAEAVGLNPESAAYTKSKPHVRAYMLQHRAAVEQQLVQKEADGLLRQKLDRDQVLDRLWELAKLSPEMTRGSITGQVKAISMIVAMESFIPSRRPVDRLAISSEKTSAPATTQPQIDPAAWVREKQATNHATTNDPQPNPAQKENGPGNPEPKLAPGSSQPTFANRTPPSQTPVPYVPLLNSVPDLGIDFSIKKTLLNPFVRPR